MGLAVLNQAKHLAAEMLEASPADIAAVAGELSVAGVTDSAIPLAEIANYAEATDRRLSESEMFVPDGQAFPYGVHIAVVEVDPETGVITAEDLAKLYMWLQLTIKRSGDDAELAEAKKMLADVMQLIPTRWLTELNETIAQHIKESSPRN